MSRRSIVLVLAFVTTVGLAVGLTGAVSSAVPSSQQKFCTELTGAGGASSFAQVATSGTGARGLTSSLRKLSKTATSKHLKSSLKTLSKYFGRLAKGKKLDSFSAKDASKFEAAVAKLTSAAASCVSSTSSTIAASAGGLSGTWSGQYTGDSQGTFSLTWQQSQSILTGTITISGFGGVPVNINGTVSGTAINFGTVGGTVVTYMGTVSGSSMSGSWQAGGTSGTWTATKTS